MRKPLGQALAQGEQPHLQPLDEEREPQHHEHEPADDAAEIGEGLAQDRNLEDRDHHDDRRQVAKRAQHEAGEGEEPSRQSIPPQLVECALHCTTSPGQGIGGRIHCDSGSESFAI